MEPYEMVSVKAVEPIQRRKLYQDVVDRLMQRIESGALAVGDQLPSERELMEVFGVGRVAVREALQEMARSGIVEISHGERAKVVVPTAKLLMGQVAEGAKHLLRMQPETLDHLKDARLFLEIGMVRMAAERATPEDVERLQQRLEDHRKSDLNGFLKRDMLFHREIAAITGNPIFSATVEAMFNWASEYYQSIVRAPGAEDPSLAKG